MPTEEYERRKAQYIKNYQKEHYKLIAIKLRKDNDKDILETLGKEENTSEFCKKAIRYYVENSGK